VTTPATTPDGYADLRRLVDPAVRADPYPVLHRLRTASPFVAGPGLVVVGRYADCDRVLRDPTVSSARDGAGAGGRPAGPRTRNFLHLDPPDHTRLRKLVAAAFSPRVVAGLAPRVHGIVAELLAAAAARGDGTLEVVGDLAYPLPVRVICELLGVPYADHAVFQQWSADLAGTLDPSVPGLFEPVDPAGAGRTRAQFIAYVRGLVAQRRREPGDDLLTRLVQVRDGDDRLTESELIATCILLLTGGHETTVNLVGNGILALLRHPERLRALRADPSLAPAVVEETLRYDAPVQFTTRIARAPFRLGGVDVAPGDVLLLLLGAANRDPAVATDPDEFDPDRTPSRHLALSAGPHFCLGAALARLEGVAAFAAFASVVQGPALAAEPVYRPVLNLRGPAELRVRVTGYARSTA
jgi:hypothetical protein